MLWHTSPLPDMGQLWTSLPQDCDILLSFQRKDVEARTHLHRELSSCAVQGILGGPASAWSPVDLTAVFPACKGLPGFQAHLGQTCLFLLTLLQPVIA